MFEVGERVVCIDARPEEIIRDGRPGRRVPCGLKVGQIYTVLSVYPRGTSVEYGAGHRVIFGCDHIAVGVPDCDGHDSWWCERFRKINGLDISEGLAKVKALCMPADEKAAA